MLFFQFEGYDLEPEVSISHGLRMNVGYPEHYGTTMEQTEGITENRVSYKGYVI